MNYAQKMWKRVLSMTLAVVLVMGMIPVTKVHAAEASSVELSESIVKLEKNETAAVEIKAVYDDEIIELVSDEYSVEWNSENEEIVTVSDGTIKGTGRGTAEVTVIATYTKDGEEKTSTGVVSVEVWETPSVTVTAEPNNNPATYPAKVKFIAVTESQGTVAMSIKKDGTETEYIAGDEVELDAGEYTIIASVTEDSGNFYKEAEGSLTYTVNKASTSVEADVKSSVYWNEKFTVTLPKQEYEGFYTVLAENITVKKSDGTEIDSATTLDAEEVLSIVADQSIGGAKLTVVYTPTDLNNYEEFTKEYPVAVNAVPVKAVWEGSYTKTYDGIGEFTVTSSPVIVLDGIEEFDGYETPVFTNSGDYTFTLNSVNAGSRIATLDESCSLVLDDTSHYTLTDATPEINVTVEKIILHEEDVQVSDAFGKAYDGTSNAVINATIVGDNIVGTELADKSMNLSFDANYYTGAAEEFGSPTQNVTAEKIVLSNLKVMEGGTESENYAFVEGQNIIVEGSYNITANDGFLEFTGMDSLGIAVNEKRQEEIIEIHWFKEKTVISKDGYKFAKSPDNLKVPVWGWANSYTVNSAEPTIIYAKDTSSRAVSGPIYVAADTTSAEGQIYAEIDGGGAVSITDLTTEYKKLTKGNDVTITFEGTDADSKIAKVDVYGSDGAWTVNDESAWMGLTGFTSNLVNEDTEKEAVVKISVDTVTKEQELKKFYYARVTDFAGNVSYVSSGGVLQDITLPTAEIALVTDNTTKTYDEKNVYDGTVGFTLAIEDLGKTSGIAEVEVILKNNQGSIVGTYSADADIWTSVDDITEISTLKATVNPTEAQIQAANTCAGEDGLTAELNDLADGYYTLTAKVVDKVGNESEESTVSFIKDNAEPIVKVDNKLTYNEDRTVENLYTGGSYVVTIQDMTLTTTVDDLITGIDDVTANWSTETDVATGLVTKTITLNFGKDALYEEGHYSFKVIAKDVFERETSHETGDFTIDYTAPTYKVSYSDTHENAYEGDDNKLYYNTDIVAEIVINEETTFNDDIIIVSVKNAESEEVIKWKDDIASVSNNNFILEHEADTRNFKLTIKGVAENDNDGYAFSIEGKDNAGNVLEAAIPEEGEKDSATELAKVRAMDVTAPVLNNVEYDTADAFNTVGTRDYVNAPTKMTFTIAEHNPVTNKSFITSDNEEKDSEWTNSETDIYTTELNVPMLGEKGDEQKITLKIVDKAGNVAVLGNDIKLRSVNNTIFEAGLFTDKFTVDTVLPVIKLEYETFNPDRLNVESIDYFKQPVTVKVIVDEHNFDESLFTQLVERTDENVTYEETNWANTADEHVKTFTFSKDNQYNLSIHGTDNAKNVLKLTAVDKVTATSGENSTVLLKVAVDQTLPAIGDTAKPVVVITPAKPANTTLDKHDLYNKDVTYRVVVYDPLLNNYASGIDNITFSVKGEDGTSATCTVDKTGKIENGNGVIVTRVGGDVEKLAKGADNKYTFNVKIASETFNTNGIVLSVNAEDVSTNKKDISAKPIAIDITAPKAVVTYDNNDVSNEKYFHAERTATITVTERNFSDDCFQFLVNEENQKLEFKLSSKGTGNRDNAVWTATYTFSTDGDYEVECTLEDRATNKGNVSYSGEAPQDFTIDMTNPIVKIEFDNHNVFNESYYDAQRIATVIITEHNFNGSDVVIIGEGTDAGVPVVYPTLSAWSSNGDEHRATLTYAQDALYTLDVEYEDLATNKANDVEEERFTVDTTDPELTITGVENETPYPDEVRPRIDFSDNNYDRYEAVLTRTERENIGVDVTEEIIGTIGVAIDATGKGVGGKLIEDVEHLEENDGIYTLTVTVYDKAGRSKEETVVYSVNRFGSVYVYSEDLAAMLKGYHQKANGDLYITAYNADQLIEDSTKLEITCDGAALANQNSQADVAEALQPNNGGWFEYKFELAHVDFSNDGRYMITISDKDEAGNTRTNSDSPIEFYIDATAPVLDSVIGLEEAIVNANEQNVQYTISDAIALENVKIYVDDKEIDNIKEFESLTAHNSTFTIGAGMKQKIRIVAEDKAGNVLDTTDESFVPAYAFNDEITVSTNFFVRWYANTPLFWGSMVGIAAVIAGGIFFLIMKKRKEQDDEEV